jgi:hypothetical protein
MLSATAASATTVHRSWIRPAAQRSGPKSRRLTVLAVQEPDRQQQQVGSSLSNVQQDVESLLKRYDFLSAGVGALAVTSFCVARGQDPATALGITAASTVVALLANDLFCNDN